MTREKAIAYFNYGITHDIFSEPVISYAKMAIAALREQPRWIPVEERLPEKYTLVLCYKDNQWRLGYYIGAGYSKGVAAFRHPRDQFAFGVTHWMPLPEPPKEEV